MPNIECRAVSVFVLKRDADEPKILLLRRTQSLVGTWCQVAGGIEKYELAWQTALRETREETGIVLSELWSADMLEQFYVAAKDTIELLPVFLSWVPQNTCITLNQEHDAYRWVGFAEAYEFLSFPGQRKTLDSIKANFVDNQPSQYLKININH